MQLKNAPPRPTLRCLNNGDPPDAYAQTMIVMSKGDKMTVARLAPALSKPRLNMQYAPRSWAEICPYLDTSNRSRARRSNATTRRPPKLPAFNCRDASVAESSSIIAIDCDVAQRAETP